MEASLAAASAAWISLHCGSAATNRQLQTSAPARSAAGEVRESPLRARGCPPPRLRPLPSVLGQRLPKEQRVRERSGKWRRLRQPGVGGKRRSGEAQGGEEGKRRQIARHRAAAGSTAAGLGKRQSRPRALPVCLKHSCWVVLVTGGTPLTAPGYCLGLPEVCSAGRQALAWRRLLTLSHRRTSCSQSTHPSASPPRGAHVSPARAPAVWPRAPAARRARLCEVAPIVPHGDRLFSPASRGAAVPGAGEKGVLFISLATISCVKAAEQI